MADVEHSLTPGGARRASTAVLSAWQRTWMTAAIAIWVVSMTLTGLQAAFVGWTLASMWISYPAPDAYPKVLGVNNIRFSPPEARLKPGDLLVAIDEFDVRGDGPLALTAHWYPYGEGKIWERSRYDGLRFSRAGGTTTFRYLRDGELHTVTANWRGVPYFRIGRVLGFLAGLIGVFVGLRARESPAARAYMLLVVATALQGCAFHLGSAALLLVWAVSSAIGGSCAGSLFLRWALLMPDEAAPRVRWPYWAIWLPLPVMISGAILWLTGGAFGYLDERFLAFNLTAAVIVLLGPVILVRNYRVSGPIGRRQLKWVLLAVSLFGVWMATIFVTLGLRPDWRQALVPFNIAGYLLPSIGIAIAILRFNLFDIDRILSATASLGLAVAVLLIVAVIGVPYVGATLSSALGVADATGQLLVAFALAALVLPSQRFVRPWVDRTFFKERVALMEGFESLTARIAKTMSRSSLLGQIGEQLEEFLHPESVLVYAHSGPSFTPAFSTVGSRPALERDDPLIGALAHRSLPLARPHGGPRHGDKLSPFERAALETLGAEVVLPLRRAGVLDGFVSLGRKRSGDVYTPTDLALLGSLAERTSYRLGELQGADTEERHLAAIISADVVGYSRLMSSDEQGTINALAVRRDIVGRLVREHHGRVVDFRGDDFLAEFPSALDATQCAVQIQQEVREQNEGLASGRRMEFRLGVHLGDVVRRGERIYGDGVNIATRLEALAEPGGICISGTVHEQVHRKLDLSYEDLGEQSVKNIPDPVRVYRLWER